MGFNSRFKGLKWCGKEMRMSSSASRPRRTQCSVTRLWKLWN